MLVGCFVVGVIGVGQASALEPSPTPSAAAAGQPSEEYRRLVATGVLEYNLGHWEEARTFFTRAHAISANARTLRALGLVAYELRNYVSAVRYLQDALDSREQPLDEPSRAAVASRLGDAKAFITRVSFTVEPRDASVLVDEQPATFDETGKLMLDPGKHRIQVSAAGFESYDREYLATGEPTQLTIALQRSVQLARPVSVVAVKIDDRSFWSRASTPHKFALGLGAAGVIGLGVGATFGLMALDAKSDARAHCELNQCDAEGVDNRDRALANADVASVSFIAGGALAGGALVLFLLGLNDDDSSAQPLAAAFDRNGVTVSARGVF
jgi:tetratricopeptide (TPR) repeat protein